jgi:recombinational DNA repair protein (RecF pathway)
VFDAYARAIMALADGETPELPLRRFEFLLLQALGYAVDFEYAADDDSPSTRPALRLRAGGFVACERAPDPRTLFLGAHLLAFAEGVSTRLLAAGGQAFQPAGAAALSGQASVEEPGAVFKKPVSSLIY